MSLSATKASANCWSCSLTLTPRNCTSVSAYSSDTSLKCGVSTRHGGHQDPQKFRTATFPASADDSKASPSSSLPENSGAVSRCPSGITSPAGVAATYRNSPPLFTSTASGPLVQPVRTAAAVSSARNARRTITPLGPHQEASHRPARRS
jgi:hypothetical protein